MQVEIRACSIVAVESLRASLDPTGKVGCTSNFSSGFTFSLEVEIDTYVQSSVLISLLCYMVKPERKTRDIKKEN